MNVFLSKKIKPFLSKVNWDIVIILLLGLLSLSWFRGNNLINGGDFGMPFDWIKYFKSMFSTWAEGNSFGSADYRNIASIFSYAAFGALMQSLGFSLVIIEKIFFYFWFIGGGLSMYFLCSVLGMKRLGKLAASIFFMLNPFSLIIIWRVSHGLIQMPYCFTPLVLGLYIYGLKKKLGLKYIFLACIAWLFATGSAYANPRMVVIHWGLIFLYFLSTIIYQPQERSFTIKFSLKFLGLWLGLNFYWVFPFIFSLSESLDSAHLPSLMNDIDTLKLTSSKIIKSIRMLGYWALHSGCKGDPYHPYEAYYRSTLTMAISWLIPIFVFLGLVNKESRKKPLFVFYIAVILLGIIGMAGPNSIFGGVLMSIYKSIPSLALLTRFTFLSFGISTYTIFAVLLGYGFLSVYEWGKKKTGNLVFFPLGIVAILLFVVLVWPFWTGEVTAKSGKIIPGERVKIPGYWWKAKKWFSEQKGFYRIFPLPMSQTYNMPYSWKEGYSGGDPIRWISENPVIFANTGETFKIPSIIGKIIEDESDFKEAGKLFGLLNVKYVIYRKDINWDFIVGHSGWFGHNPQKIEKFLKNQEDLTLVKSFGPWDIYEVKPGEILPHIYSPERIVGVEGEVESLIDVKQFVDMAKEKLYFSNDKNSQSVALNNIEYSYIWKRPLPYEESNKEYGLTEAVYKFKIHANGEYQIFLRNDNLWKYYQQTKTLSLKIDDKATEVRELTILENNLIDLGKINLETGDHTVTLVLPDFINLVEDYSFENLTGKEVSTDAFDGKLSLKQISQNIDSYIQTSIINFKSASNYRISFASKNIKGNKPLFLIWENYLAPSIPSIIEKSKDVYTTNISLSDVAATANWLDFSNIYSSGNLVRLAGITLVTQRSNDVLSGVSENLFDKVIIQKFFDNPILLKRTIQENPSQKTPDITFKKISPVKYKVQIKNAKEPFWLVFSEAFHPKWTLSIPGEHVFMNGFANNWYITKTGDFQATIYFKSQIINIIGGIFSVVIFISLLIYLFTDERKNEGLFLSDILNKLKSIILNQK